MIVGVTGRLCAGKHTGVLFLEHEGFKRYSCSEILYRQVEAIKEGLSRDSLIRVAERFNKEYGPGALAHMVLEQIDKDGTENACVLSIRREVELDVFEDRARKRGDARHTFFFLAFDAPLEKRYTWAQFRNLPRDHVTFEAFKKEDEREWWGIDTTICLRKLFDRADVIENNHDIADLQRRIHEKIQVYKRTVQVV